MYGKWPKNEVKKLYGKPLIGEISLSTDFWPRVPIDLPEDSSDRFLPEDFPYQPIFLIRSSRVIYPGDFRKKTKSTKMYGECSKNEVKKMYGKG